MPLFKKKKDKKKEAEEAATVEEVVVVQDVGEERGIDTEPVPSDSFDEDEDEPSGDAPPPPKPQFVQGSATAGTYSMMATKVVTSKVTTSRGGGEVHREEYQSQQQGDLPPTYHQLQEVHTSQQGYSTQQPVEYPSSQQKGGYPYDPHPGIPPSQQPGVYPTQQLDTKGQVGPYQPQPNRGPIQAASGFDYLNWKVYGKKRKGQDTTREYLLTAQALVPYVQCVVASAKEGAEEWQWKRLTQAPPPVDSAAGSKMASRLISTAPLP